MKSRKTFVLAAVSAALVTLSFFALGGGSSPNFGDPLQNLTPALTTRFLAGQASFELVETVSAGLGPVFNDVSCVACHSTPAPGGGSTTIETRFGRMLKGQFDPMTQFGGSLIQKSGIGLYNGVNFVGETVPRQATISAGRRTTPLFGLGLVNSVPDSTFEQLASLEKQYTPATAGRAAMITDQATGDDIVGRFGWKCQQGSLFTFSGDAYLNEMGVTTPLFPDENCPQGNCALLAANPCAHEPERAGQRRPSGVYRLHDLPRAATGARIDIRGQERRRDIRLDRMCQLSLPRTSDRQQQHCCVLNSVTFFPYSDFLLHDMGSLGDGIAQADAGQTEMRTAPLWGVRVMSRFLHDGRATSLSQAILAHAGQGKAARNQFANLSSRDQTNLIAFLNSL